MNLVQQKFYVSEEILMKKIFFTLVSLSMIFTFSACDNAENSPEFEEINISSDIEKTKNNDSIENISNTQTIGYWEITINSAETMDKIKNGNWEFIPSKGNKFIVINADVKNIGDKEYQFLPYMVMGNSEITAKLVCNDNEYSSTELMGNSDGLNRTTINPSESQTGTIVFEVPEDTAEHLTDMELVFTLNDDTCSFLIS